MRYFLFAMGPGETSQARALAQYMHSQGETDLTLGIRQPINLPFIEADKDIFHIEITPTPHEFHQVLSQIKPDALILCNSKMWYKEPNFQITPPSPKPFTISLDSNWLFNEEAYPHFSYVKWIDQYLVNIPPQIFHYGLQEGGGGFILPPDMRKKVKPIGLVPSYQPINQTTKKRIREKYNIEPDEKMIFAYVSGLGADARLWALTKLIEAVKEINKKNNLKVVYIGRLKRDQVLNSPPPWLIEEPFLPATDYYDTLAASDLVFQHQGLSTLAQSISARVPTIANVSIPAHPMLPEIHYWEIEPFARSGTCFIQTESMHIGELIASMNNLLFNQSTRKKMIEAQQQQYSRGEVECYKILKNIQP
jgi:hypothetical protein